mgnify:CR=1 FL=1
MHTTLLNGVGVKGITVWWGLNYFAVHQNAFKRNNLVYFPNDRNLVHFFLRLAPAALNLHLCWVVRLHVCVSANWLVVVGWLESQNICGFKLCFNAHFKHMNSCINIRAVFKWLSKKQNLSNYWPITTGPNSAMNQSQLFVTRSKRGKNHERAAVNLSFFAFAWKPFVPSKRKCTSPILYNVINME